MNDWRARDGTIDPPGATRVDGERATNFVLYSLNATGATLLIYGEACQTEPIHALRLDPLRNKSGPIWHCRVSDADAPGARYWAWRVSGPDGSDHDFDEEKVLLDPYARAVFFPPDFDREAARRPGPNDGKAPLGVLHACGEFDWEDDRPIRHGSDLVIYEMHVKGFTRDASSGVPEDRRGTFAGVIDRIPHLVELGVTAVELMPIYQYDPGEGNYWGYMTLNFFSPHDGYAAERSKCCQAEEFKRMVKALHAAGIEVILDVVYNHTCEGNRDGPVYSFKGIDSAWYYIQSGDSRRPYADYSGTGNTLEAASVAVRKLIMDSLRYWRDEMHVDGFRFDLASIFARRSDGSLDDRHPPIFGQIASGRGFLDTRLIAEPWDAGGAYQLGREFPGWLWSQWNAKFRETMQRFVKGDHGMVPDLMTRIYGSADLFPDDPYHSCRPWQSINYVVSHDGSTLSDLVTFEQKHNEANGHENRDGPTERKWNCGFEGEVGAPPGVVALRRRQAKNFLALLLLSNGAPMIRMGDEFLATQGGNTNPYNQDNETSWLDWERLEANRDHFRFVSEMIAFRKAHPSIHRAGFWREDVHWYGTTGAADLSFPSRTLAFCLLGASEGDRDLYVMINAHSEPLDFAVRESRPGGWRRVVDTALPSPTDIVPEADAERVGNVYEVAGNSVVVLTS